MNLDIPGYYWDDEKQRHFKIEGSATAPADAAWSAENVLKRSRTRLESEAESSQQARTPARVQRSSFLQDAVLGMPYRASVGDVTLKDMAPAFAQGIVAKGYVEPDRMHRTKTRQFTDADTWLGKGTNISSLYISGSDDGTGLGRAFFTDQSGKVLSKKICRDKNDNIVWAPPEEITWTMPSRNRVAAHASRSERYELWSTAERSSISYHRGTNKLLVTNRGGNRNRPAEHSLEIISPSHLSDDRDDFDENAANWLLDSQPRTEFNFRRTGSPQPGTAPLSIHACAPAPASSSELLCALGTDFGVVTLPKITNPTLPRPATLRTAVYGVDFRPDHPSTLAAAGRARHLRLTDLRAGPADGPPAWSVVGASRSTAHVRFVNEFHLLAAGLGHALNLYDIRFARDVGGFAGAVDAGRQGVQPLLPFAGYRNAAHLCCVGFDVDVETGLVAAAHDDGCVALYSLRTGRRVPCPSVDAVPATGVPVHAVQFAKLPKDKNANLFLGLGMAVFKFSFGRAAGAEDM